jgi:thioredoxin 2
VPGVARAAALRTGSATGAPLSIGDAARFLRREFCKMMGMSPLELRCASCGAVNRVPETRAGMPARCGRCHRPLATTVVPVEVTDATFEATVTRSGAPVLLDCWADWCGPCHALAPTIDAVARAYAGRVVVGKLDVDANPSTATRFEVRSIPTLLLFSQGRLVDRLVGVHPRAAIDARLRTLLGEVASA